MMPNKAFLIMETATLRAKANSAEKVSDAVNRGDLTEAHRLARQHELAWQKPEREFQDLNLPHITNDFCDDE
ncbi:MAG: hypothetical protein EBZ78_02530 [Verrucomicrobia bacterium]|jgi:hypothetical protein|nr:hypothetical protein [Verrucomicrobiota bacterium]